MLGSMPLIGSVFSVSPNHQAEKRKLDTIFEEISPDGVPEIEPKKNDKNVSVVEEPNDKDKESSKFDDEKLEKTFPIHNKSKISPVQKKPDVVENEKIMPVESKELNKSGGIFNFNDLGSTSSCSVLSTEITESQVTSQIRVNKKSKTDIENFSFLDTAYDKDQK
eukprot:UN31224